MSEYDSQQDPGLSLREAREAAGLSAKEVAESLNLLVSNVEAIEANNFRAMNADIFVRGYVTSYARFLNLDVDPLLEATDALLNAQKRTAAKKEVVVASPVKPVHRVVAALVMAVVIWAFCYFLLVSHGSAPVESGSADSVEDEG